MRGILWLALAGCAGLPELAPTSAALPAVDAPGEELMTLRAAWKERPDDVRLNVALAKAHDRCCEALLPKDPEHGRHYIAAIFHARRALATEPDPEAKYWLAAALLHAANAENSLGRAKEALRLLHEADAAAPAIDEGGPSRLAAKVYGDAPTLILGDRAKAQELYRKSIGLAPGQYQARLWLGELYVRLGKSDAARVELELALRVRPEDLKARELLDRIGGSGPTPPPPR